MSISRRSMLSGVAVLLGAFTAPAAQACTVTAQRIPIAFSDRACRRSLRALIELIKVAHAFSDDELMERADGLRIEFAEDVTDPLLDYPTHHPIEARDVIRALGTSDGQRDRSPIELSEMNLLKSRKGVGIYQFTLRRDLYHRAVTDEEAEGDSCGFMQRRDAYYAEWDKSYLGLFINNKLRKVSAFDDWLLGL